MFSVGQELYLETDLKRAKLAQLPVMVKYDDGEIADYGGPIQELNKDAVKINGMYYTKATCRFYVR
ncbi:hypothetical protein I8J29_16570 [Paenibacillus sp. MWE-103]|uniref:Uncharacterized protein n=1 Tax=Paenibacillus artemisiicola TaxID=1172618 RepID=A0ABS3WBY3_9BACL|nr:MULTISPECIES: hypothetical protein [Paenibacillus]MBO7745824.1 hypothetical protein [Paenibacillus artemisiicola]SFJ76960.1 hypothetical protein SAMN02799624_05886 [Paenibacillus sp. UNC496MF]